MSSTPSPEQISGLIAQLIVGVPADPETLSRARAAATSSRDRQLVAITAAHLSGDRDLAAALAADFLADHPGDSLTWPTPPSTTVHRTTAPLARPEEIR